MGCVGRCRWEVQVKGTSLPFQGLFLTWISLTQLAPVCSVCWLWQKDIRDQHLKLLGDCYLWLLYLKFCPFVVLGLLFFVFLFFFCFLFNWGNTKTVFVLQKAQQMILRVGKRCSTLPQNGDDLKSWGKEKNFKDRASPSISIKFPFLGVVFSASYSPIHLPAAQRQALICNQSKQG